MEKFVKIDGNKIYENDENYDCLVTKVKEVVDFKTNQYRSNILEALEDCESPIEQIMALEIYDRLIGYYQNSNIELLGNTNQKYIKVNQQLYRVDFLIEFAFKIDGEYLDILKLIIECDGHEFHEKTKEQVKKDNKRDRDLQSEGYDILHFSGSEIYNEWYKCGREITKYINNKYYDFFKKNKR